MQFLQKCVQCFAVNSRISSIKKSSVYVTKPWGKVDQPDFLNAVLEIETEMMPWQLLRFGRILESAAGRQRGGRWGPRTLDVDILYAVGCEVDDADLKIPHPLMTQRLFVMKPLADLAPDLILRQNGEQKSVRQWCNTLEQDAILEKLYEPDEW